MIRFIDPIQLFVGLGIFVVALGLAALSLQAYRRERDRRMLLVTAAYAMFMGHGIGQFAEYALVGTLDYSTLELIEHGSGVLVLLGLLGFFVALVRE